MWEKPPAPASAVPVQAAVPRVEAAPAESVTEEELPAGEAVPTARQNGIYTLLLVGSDDGNGNTDTLILGRIDTEKHRMDFVNIPRDTLINSPWEVRKINAVYWGARNQGGDGIAALKQQIARLTGFEPDCCAVVDLELFQEAVDAVGGIWFDVPMAMDYEDASQDLAIHLQPGYQLLNGEQAMGLCRFRSGYVMGDLGRIDMQQQFLKACVSQFLTLGNIPHVTGLLRLLSERLETDLSAANLAFFLRQFLACRAEDICFHTAPGTPEIIAGYSYEVLELDRWLELINRALNPFDTPITWDRLDLVYRSGDGYAGTAGLRDADYYLRGKSQQTASAPEELAAEGDGSYDAQIITSSDQLEEAGEPAGSGDEEGGTPAIIVIGP